MLSVIPLLIAVSLSAFAESWPPSLPETLSVPRTSQVSDCPLSGQRIEPLEQQADFAIQRLDPAGPADLPIPADDLDRASAVLAARRTLGYWERRPPGTTVAVGSRRYSAARMAESFSALASLLESIQDPAALKQALVEKFDLFWAVTDAGEHKGTVTAYFDADIPVSPGGETGTVPVLSRPSDLVRIDSSLGLPFDYGRSDGKGGFVPYDSRSEIFGGSLAGRGLELYRTRHATDLLILQTEGSGWAVFPDGRRKRLAFDGANGHVFKSVGRALMDCGLIPRSTPSMEILAYLKSQTPEREAELVGLNPRYVFFKEAGPGGPWGASGLELVGGRSIAVDPSRVPLGLGGLIISKKPVADDNGRIVRFEDFTRFIFTHDTGSAIRGPTRVDLFWGGGPKAEAEAHNMLFPGKLYFLVLKDPAHGARDGR